MRKIFKRTFSMFLALMMVMTLIPSSVFANTIESNGVDLEWYNFRNNQENNGVTDRATPIDINETWMRYGVKYGDGWSAAPTPPLILDGHLYIGKGNQVLKLDKKNGDLIAESDPMMGNVGFAMNPILYADGKLFVQVGNGVIQALDYKTLKCVWHTPKIKGQTISPIAYTKGKDGKGYIYTGTWTSESTDGTFFCVSTDDENVVNGEKKPTWSFVPKQNDKALHDDEESKPRGFYWAGAYANENYVAIGSDDGTAEGDYTANAVFYTLNTTTGEIIDRIDHIKGDIRSTIVYDNGFLYFNTKGGLLYKVPVNKDGTFDHEHIQHIDLGGMTTATPLVYKNKIYLGVAGHGGQFDPDGGHRFAVVDNEGPLKELYSLPIKGYPQAGALLSTAHENEDYDGDGNPDGRVYLYFTYNAPPGGIYYTYDTPNRTEASKTQGEIFIPNKEDQEHCISTIIADREGTLYYKNDSCKIFAVEINPAYLTGIKVKAGGKDAQISPSVNPQIRNYKAVVPSVDKATIELQLPEGVTAKVEGKSYTGKAMEVSLPKDVTEIKIQTYKDNKERKYTVSFKKQLENAYLGELFVNNSNNSSAGKVVQVSPELNQSDTDYIADMTNVSQSSFYNIWAMPSEDSSKVEVRAVSNFDSSKHKDKDNPEKPLIKPIKEQRTGKNRYPLYLKDKSKSAEVEIKVTTDTGKTERVYKLTLLKKVDVESVEIIGAEREIFVGDKIVMEAKVLPENATNKNVKWSVYPENVASIDEKTGELTALAPGEASVGVTTEDHGITVTCKVTVKPLVVNAESVEIIGGDKSVNVDDKLKLQAIIKPENTTNKKVTWEVDNTELASIDAVTGDFTALKPGEVTVKVTTEDGKLSDTCKITINATPVHVTSVEIKDGDRTVSTGDKVTFEAIIKPEDATNKNVTWEVDNTDIATIDSVTGEFIALKDGVVNIKVTSNDGNLTATCKVIVEKKIFPVTGIEILNGNQTIKVGDKLILEALVKPENATNKNVIWSVDNTDIATIDSKSGELSALAKGEVTVTVMTEDGQYVATCKVIIDSDQVIEPSKPEVKPEVKPEIKPEVKPENGKVPATGDNNMIVGYGLLVIIGLGALYFLKKKKNTK